MMEIADFQISNELNFYGHLPAQTGRLPDGIRIDGYPTELETIERFNQ